MYKKLERCWYGTRISCCVRRIFSQGDDSPCSRFPRDWERQRSNMLIIMLAGSASLERKNKLQGPKREFPPVPWDKPSPWGPLTVTPVAGRACWGKRTAGGASGPLMESTGTRNAGRLLLVETKPRLTPTVSWGTWSCCERFSTAKKRMFRKCNRSHFSSTRHDLKLVETGPEKIAVGPQVWDGAPRWAGGGIRVYGLTSCVLNDMSSLLF